MDLLDLRKSVSSTPVAATDLVPREEEFYVEYVDPDTGVRLEGRCVSLVPDKSAKTDAGRIMAALAGRVRYDDMPAQWRGWAYAIACCLTQLKEFPDWLIPKLEVDDQLLTAVQGRLDDHADRYFLGAGAPGESQTAAPRVAIRAAAPGKAASPPLR